MGFNSAFKGLKNTKNSCVLTETKPNTLSYWQTCFSYVQCRSLDCVVLVL